MSQIILKPRKCLDGKIRLKPVKSYDCVNYKWHKQPFIWSECGLSHKDCNFSNNPFRCENFKEREI